MSRGLRHSQQLSGDPHAGGTPAFAHSFSRTLEQQGAGLLLEFLHNDVPCCSHWSSFGYWERCPPVSTASAWPQTPPPLSCQPVAPRSPR